MTRSFSFLIAINAEEKEKFSFFVPFRFLARKFYRWVIDEGASCICVRWWGGLIYMRKTDTISNKRGSLCRGFNLCNFQEERKRKINEISFHPHFFGSISSIWIIMFSLKGNTDRENPFVCARWCKISLPPLPPFHSCNKIIQRKIHERKNLLIFYPFSISFFRIFYFVRFLMGWWMVVWKGVWVECRRVSERHGILVAKG